MLSGYLNLDMLVLLQVSVNCNQLWDAYHCIQHRKVLLFVVTQPDESFLCTYSAKYFHLQGHESSNKLFIKISFPLC